jgi:hypothetical protein
MVASERKKGNYAIINTHGALNLIRQGSKVAVDDNGRNLPFAADEIGSFSLTNRRVAVAMAKLLLRACIYGPQGFTKNNDCKRIVHNGWYTSQ